MNINKKIFKETSGIQSVAKQYWTLSWICSYSAFNLKLTAVKLKITQARCLKLNNFIKKGEVRIHVLSYFENRQLTYYNVYSDL